MQDDSIISITSRFSAGRGILAAVQIRLLFSLRTNEPLSTSRFRPYTPTSITRSLPSLPRRSRRRATENLGKLVILFLTMMIIKFDVTYGARKTSLQHAHIKEIYGTNHSAGFRSVELRAIHEEIISLDLFTFNFPVKHPWREMRSPHGVIRGHQQESAQPCCVSTHILDDIPEILSWNTLAARGFRGLVKVSPRSPGRRCSEILRTEEILVGWNRKVLIDNAWGSASDCSSEQRGLPASRSRGHCRCPLNSAGV